LVKAVGVPARSLGWLSDKRLSRIVLIFGGLLLLCLLLGLFAYLLVQDLFAFGAFPTGVKIVGVSVAGLSRTEAIEKCRSELADVASRPLTLQVDEEKYQISAQDIGLLLNYRGMVEEAYQKAWSVNLLERMARRFTNRPKELNVSLLAQGNSDRVHGWVSDVINQINRYPQDAYVDVTSAAAVIVKAKDGRNANLNELLAETDAALRSPDRTVNVRVGRVGAKVTDEVFGRLIIINIAEHKLSLYDREKLLAEFPVACGSSTYPTPVGKWKIVEKQLNPTWHNPGSDWARSMPPSIPPGPSNPLGSRAMALNASGVLIHGTPSSWSIGQNVSHGCVRMYMADVERLFDMVEVNTPVYVIRSAGDPGFDVTKKPYWQK
jgi:lipoprotein-anchoring transpeptidase ErfK/SrfK